MTRRIQLKFFSGALIAVGLAGCGGGSDSAGAPLDAGAEQCFERFNADSNAVEQSRHFYEEHGARRAMLIETQPGKGIGAPKDQACAVIYASFIGDLEYGTNGLTELKFGWASMVELAKGRPSVDLNEIQSRATEDANVDVFPDGSLGK